MKQGEVASMKKIDFVEDVLKNMFKEFTERKYNLGALNGKPGCSVTARFYKLFEMQVKCSLRKRETESVRPNRNMIIVAERRKGTSNFFRKPLRF